MLFWRWALRRDWFWLLLCCNLLFANGWKEKINVSSDRPPEVFAANWFCPPCADCVRSYKTPVWERKANELLCWGCWGWFSLAFFPQFLLYYVASLLHALCFSGTLDDFSMSLCVLHSPLDPGPGQVRFIQGLADEQEISLRVWIDLDWGEYENWPENRT